MLGTVPRDGKAAMERRGPLLRCWLERRWWFHQYPYVECYMYSYIYYILYIIYIYIYIYIYIIYYIYIYLYIL